MKHLDNYWTRRIKAGRFSRRRFVGGTAATGIGVAGLGLVGCGDDDDDDGDDVAPTNTTAAGGTPAATATTTDAPDPTATAEPSTQKQRGGVARFSSANATYDTFDADRTRFGPMGTLLGYTMQPVVGWESYTDAKLGGYFAESWEQPDNQSFTFHVRQNLFWHDKPPVNGRAANANDIVHHIERNKAGVLKDGSEDANFYRKPVFEVVDKVEAVDDMTVAVTMTKPWPFFLNTLAGIWTKVQSPEAVDMWEDEFAEFSADKIIGTGDFMLTDFSSEGRLSFRRHPKAWREPWWDGVDFVPLFTDAVALQAAFEQAQIDSYSPATVDVLNDIKGKLEGSVYEVARFAQNPVASTFYGGTAPWKDLRLIGAIMQSIDRRGLIQQLLQGRGAMAAFPPPAWSPFALPENEVVTYPGYLEDRDADLADAKAKWDAAAGADLGEITVDIPDIYEGAYAGASSIITNQLHDLLGNTFTAKLEPYATITSKIVNQQYGNGANNIWFGWINPPTDPDPSGDFIRIFDSRSTQYAQWEVPLPGMDAINDKLSEEFDSAKRVDLCHQAARILLDNVGGGIPELYLQILNILYWNYMKLGEIVTFETSHNTARDLWFDQTDASWASRPA